MVVKHKKEMESHSKQTLINGIKKNSQEDNATCALMLTTYVESSSKKSKTEQTFGCSNDGSAGSTKEGKEFNPDDEEREKDLSI